MSATYRPGTVVRYRSERENRWCREGMAIANDEGRLVDTYWSLRGQDSHIVTESEQPSVEVLFHLDDYDELPHGYRETWETYHPDDRQLVTGQHGLERRHFIRKGAQPDLQTQIANARDRVADAEQKVRSAEDALRWRRQELASLEAQAVIA